MNIDAEAKSIYSVLKNVSMYPGRKWTLQDCKNIAPFVLEINKLKKQKDCVILAHSYVLPEVVFTVADFTGDSYALSAYARTVKNKNIIFAGVWFMAETAKILNPDKNIYIPAGRAGCTLADSLTRAELENFKFKHPKAKSVCYINSSAEVKAECDVCVTSSNVYDIVAALPGDEVIFVPDTYMADNVREEMKKRGVNKKIYGLGGSCCVHDQYMPFHVKALREQAKSIKILAHPECHRDVCKLCDYVGSTSGMLEYVKKSKDKNFGLLTEYGLVNRLEAEHPDKNFFWSFGKCAFMKRNTLQNVLQCMQEPAAEQTVKLDFKISLEAERCVENMFRMTANRKAD